MTQPSWTTCDACPSREGVTWDDDSGQYLCVECKKVLDLLMERQ